MTFGENINTVVCGDALEIMARAGQMSLFDALEAKP